MFLRFAFERSGCLDLSLNFELRQKNNKMVKIVNSFEQREVKMVLGSCNAAPMRAEVLGRQRHRWGEKTEKQRNKAIKNATQKNGRS